MIRVFFHHITMKLFGVLICLDLCEVALVQVVQVIVPGHSSRLELTNRSESFLHIVQGMS